MIISATSEDIASMLAEILRADLEIGENKTCLYTDIFPRNDEDEKDIVFSLDLNRIDAILEALQSKTETDETILFDSNVYEVLVKQESRRPPFLFLGREMLPFEVEDIENGLVYSLDHASDAYFLFILYKLSSLTPLRMLYRPVHPRMKDRFLQNDDLKTYDVIELAKHFIGMRMLTLRITSAKNRNKIDFEKFADAYFFQLSYNFDEAILPQRYLDELLRPAKIRRIRRTSIDELEAPKRTFIADLIHHYQLAIASENPALEFLSYYHIIEHFFEKIYQEAQIEEIRELITQPEFSYKRDKDIRKLITRITSGQKVDGDNVRYDELESLKLTLHKFVTPSNLVSKLQEYDNDLIDFYKKEKVTFSGGDAVNLTIEGDDQQIITLLAKRIYRTRNALVHSKDGDKGKFVPFKHDKDLIREIPLMRFVAEIIIVQSSKVM